MNLSCNNDELLGNFTWKGTFNDDSVYFGENNDFNHYAKDDFKFSDNEASYKHASDNEDAHFATKLQDKPTILPPLSFPVAEMMSSNGHGDLKLMNFHESIIANEEADSKCSQESPKTIRFDSQSVYSLKTKSALSEYPTKVKDCETNFEGEKQLNQDIDALIGSLTSTPHFKDQRFSTRRDVVNKTVFRIMKRYYIQLFKDMFPKIKSKNTSVEKYLAACSELIKTLKGYISVNDHLKYFFVQMINNKLLKTVSLTGDLAKSLDLMNTCLYSYSDKALKKLFDDSSSRLLFNYFYENGQSFFLEQTNVQKNLSGYKDALDSIYKSFNGNLLK